MSASNTISRLTLRSWCCPWAVWPVQWPANR